MLFIKETFLRFSIQIDHTLAQYYKKNGSRCNSEKGIFLILTSQGDKITGDEK